MHSRLKQSKQKRTIPVEVYIHPVGRFEKHGGIWKEYPEHGSQPIYTFEELWRGEKYIYLYDLKRRKDPGRPMYLRIPREGGIVQWSFPNPLEWIDLLVVRSMKAE